MIPVQALIEIAIRGATILVPFVLTWPYLERVFDGQQKERQENWNAERWLSR